jgi:hypothetical protein
MTALFERLLRTQVSNAPHCWVGWTGHSEAFSMSRGVARARAVSSRFFRCRAGPSDHFDAGSGCQFAGSGGIFQQSVAMGQARVAILSILWRRVSSRHMQHAAISCISRAKNGHEAVLFQDPNTLRLEQTSRVDIVVKHI